MYWQSIYEMLVRNWMEITRVLKYMVRMNNLMLGIRRIVIEFKTDLHE